MSAEKGCIETIEGPMQGPSRKALHARRLLDSSPQNQARFPKARFARVSPAGQKEAAPHDVVEVSTRTN